MVRLERKLCETAEKLRKARNKDRRVDPKYFEKLVEEADVEEPVADSLFYHYILEEGNLGKTLEKLKEDEKVVKALENPETGRKLGMELEIPLETPGQVCVEDVGEKFLWHTYGGEKYVENEDMPETVEIKAGPSKNLYNLSLSISRKLEAFEKICESEDLLGTDFSCENYSESFPGIHVHVENRLDEKKLEQTVKRFGDELPLISFLTANQPGTYMGMKSLSKRQVKHNYGFAKGHIIRNECFDTVEYRIPDALKERQRMEAVASIFLGLQKFYSENPGKDVNEELNQIFYGNDKTLSYLTGEKKPLEEEMEKFKGRVGEGLALEGVYDERYFETLERMYLENMEKSSEMDLKGPGQGLLLKEI